MLECYFDHSTLNFEYNFMVKRYPSVSKEGWRQIVGCCSPIFSDGVKLCTEIRRNKHEYIAKRGNKYHVN